jgi:hypothetical protein
MDSPSIRLIGILVGVLILVYTINKYRRGRYRRLDLLIGVIVGLGAALLSAFPAAADVLTDLFGLRNRLFATLVFTNMVMFGLFLYVLNKANQANRTIGDLIRALAREDFKRNYQLGRVTKLIAIVIPAYNEEQAIGGVLSQLPNRLFDYEVWPIVVVDGAADNTAEVVRRANYLVTSHVLNCGQGDALRTGFELALQQGAEIVVTMDADGQHRPEDLEQLVLPVIQGEADYVTGSRFLGDYEDQGGWRHLGIILFTWLINLLGGVKITDCTNGFRAISASALSKLQLKEDRFSAPELIMETAKKGLRIREVPVTIASRAAGESKKPRRLGYPFGFLRTIVQVWFR